MREGPGTRGQPRKAATQLDATGKGLDAAVQPPERAIRAPTLPTPPPRRRSGFRPAGSPRQRKGSESHLCAILRGEGGLTSLDSGVEGNDGGRGKARYRGRRPAAMGRGTEGGSDASLRPRGSGAHSEAPPLQHAHKEGLGR